MVSTKVKVLIASTIITATLGMSGSVVVKATPVDMKGDSSKIIAETLSPKQKELVANAQKYAEQSLANAKEAIKKVDKKTLTGEQAQHVVNLAETAMYQAKNFHDVQSEYRMETTASRKAVREAWKMMDKTSNFLTLGAENDKKHQQAVSETAKTSKAKMGTLAKLEEQANKDLKNAQDSIRGLDETSQTKLLVNVKNLSEKALESARHFRAETLKVKAMEGLNSTDKKTVLGFNQRSFTAVWRANSQMKAINDLMEFKIKAELKQLSNLVSKMKTVNEYTEVGDLFKELHNNSMVMSTKEFYDTINGIEDDIVDKVQDSFDNAFDKQDRAKLDFAKTLTARLLNGLDENSVSLKNDINDVRADFLVRSLNRESRLDKKESGHFFYTCSCFELYKIMPQTESVDTACKSYLNSLKLRGKTATLRCLQDQLQYSDGGHFGYLADYIKSIL